MRCFVLIASIIGLISCSTSKLERLERLEVGMEKPDVIDRVGGPTRTVRKNGRDHWIYILGTGLDKTHRQVSFRKGRVVEISDIKDPLGSKEAVESARDMEEYKARVEERKLMRDEGFKNKAE